MSKTHAFPRSSGAIGWGILATGGIAGTFTRELIAHGHRVSAVGSRSQASAEAFAATHGIPRAHGTYEDLVADPTVDVVYIATPHNLHATNALLALEHGKHILVEKSFTLTEEEARAVTELAQRKGLVVVEAMWTRFLPHMEHVRAMIAAGGIGEVRSLHADHTQSLPRDETHRINNPHLAGGALLDLGIYPISFAHDILGLPVHIDARATFTRSGVDASVATVFAHDNGAISTTFSSLETRGPNRASILGTEGRIEIADTWYSPSSVSLYDTKNSLVAVFNEPVSGRGMQFQAAEVERVVRDGILRSPLITPEESVAIMHTMDTIRARIGLRYPNESAPYDEKSGQHL